MGTDVAELVELPYATMKVHRSMCLQLKTFIDRISLIFPAMESARPRCSSGIQALCSLYCTMEKAKLLIQHCCESSKLYLAITADNIALSCEMLRDTLVICLSQFQNQVPEPLAAKISGIVYDLRDAKFTVESTEDEARNVLLELFQQDRAASDSVNKSELKAIELAVTRLHITSHVALLIERRSIKKLHDKVRDTSPKEKSFFKYLLYLLKKYGDSIKESTFASYEESLHKSIEPEHIEEARKETQADVSSIPEPPKEFKCPISMRLMYDPVVIASGQTFERFWKEMWFDEGNETCRKTHVKLSHLSLTPNTTTKDLISKWCLNQGVTIPNPCLQPFSSSPRLQNPTSSSSNDSFGSSIYNLGLQFGNVSLYSSEGKVSLYSSESSSSHDLDLQFCNVSLCSETSYGSDSLNVQNDDGFDFELSLMMYGDSHQCQSSSDSHGVSIPFLSKFSSSPLSQNPTSSSSNDSVGSSIYNLGLQFGNVSLYSSEGKVSLYSSESSSSHDLDLQFCNVTLCSESSYGSDLLNVQNDDGFNFELSLMMHADSHKCQSSSDSRRVSLPFLSKFAALPRGSQCKAVEDVKAQLKDNSQAQMKQFFFRNTINTISRFNGRSLSPYLYFHRNASTITGMLPSLSPYSSNAQGSTPLQNPNYLNPTWSFSRYIHSTQETKLSDSELDSNESEEDGTMTEFLSRFIWIMRGKLSEAYPDCDKQTIDGMLLIIVGKVASEVEKGGLEQMLGAAVATPSLDFSEDLWKTVWEVSNMVLKDMEKARKKEKMKEFIQSEEVKEMYRFAGEVGIRGDMLRELRFKWAREKMEETEFYESLERLRAEEEEEKRQEGVGKEAETKFVGDGLVMADEEPNVVSLPKRHGRMKYKIYGLDLSDPKWAKVADKIHETGEIIWPQEPKAISGKCKLVTDRILSLKEEDDPSPLLAEWVELLQPSKIDWINLLDKLKERNAALYFKVAEVVLSEESFQTNIRDYSKLIDAHAKEDRLEDAERVLKKMNENGILPDILTSTILVHMYSKAGNLDRAKEAYDSLRSQGFQPDMRVYESMIMAYVNVGLPKSGESLMREMEARDIKPTKEIYMALLRSFAQRGQTDGAYRIATTMQFAGFQPSLESCTLLVEAYAQAGDPEQARSNFDYMIKVGHRPDDRCTASMIAAYEKKNLLDKALDLLFHLKKDGFEPGVMTYTVLVDWLGKLLLVDEAEQLSGKIAEQSEAPPVKVHVSLCDMYLRAGLEKKALQALAIVEAKKEHLGLEEFERIIDGLIHGGFVRDARRIHGLMEAQGFAASEKVKVALMTAQAIGLKKPAMR
ncbi:hypothetical protein L1049_026761 [Liquidambar formosana]|uniref:U-box domain-containing protein n=1 Tax=Liquidambar formosana TaxID=63359 RepID=A0AAP0ND94_LIQFO